jgi:hypothetical protein
LLSPVRCYLAWPGQSTPICLRGRAAGTDYATNMPVCPARLPLCVGELVEGQKGALAIARAPLFIRFAHLCDKQTCLRILLTGQSRRPSTFHLQEALPA